MMPTTPSGRGITWARAGRNHFDTQAPRGRIHCSPCRSAPLISPRLGKISAICVSRRGRPPKSASIAASMAVSCSHDQALQALQAVAPNVPFRKRRRVVAGALALERSVQGGRNVEGVHVEARGRNSARSLLRVGRGCVPIWSHLGGVGCSSCRARRGCVGCWCWLGPCPSNAGRSHGDWSQAGWALRLHWRYVLLKVPPLAALLASLNTALDVFERALQAGTSLVFGYLGGGEPPFSRDRSGGHLRAGLPRAAAGAVCGRAVRPALPLGRPAPAGTRVRAPARAHHGPRRGCRHFRCGERLRRHGGSSASHRALPPEPLAGRALHRHELRHGDDRGNRPGPLRNLPRSGRTQRTRPPAGGIDRRDAGGDRRGGHHGSAPAHANAKQYGWSEPTPTPSRPSPGARSKACSCSSTSSRCWSCSSPWSRS